jgi:cytoskeletal protein RodZ
VTLKASDQSLEGGTRAGGADGSLGEELRRAREARKISLREISEHTRITMRHLEAIEADDYRNLPGGIFNKSFIKAYARHIHFDEKRALELYVRTLRERGEADEEAATSPRRSQVYTDGDTSRSPLVTALLSAVILGIIVLVVYAGYHWYQRKEGAASVAADPNAVGAKPNAAPAPAQPTPTPAPQPAGFNIQVRAKGEDVWLAASVDEERPSDRTLKPDEEAMQFTPQTRLALRYSKTKLDKLEVTINGQVAQAPPPNPKTGLVEWNITRDDYKQYLP